MSGSRAEEPEAPVPCRLIVDQLILDFHFGIPLSRSGAHLAEEAYETQCFLTKLNVSGRNRLADEVLNRSESCKSKEYWLQIGRALCGTWS
jgi:hypothetical protein